MCVRCGGVDCGEVFYVDISQNAHPVFLYLFFFFCGNSHIFMVQSCCYIHIHDGVDFFPILLKKNKVKLVALAVLSWYLFSYPSYRIIRFCGVLFFSHSRRRLRRWRQRQWFVMRYEVWEMKNEFVGQYICRQIDMTHNPCATAMNMV